MERGVYRYQFRVWDDLGRRVLKTHKIRVEIIEEKGNRYRVRYMEYHANGDAPNSLHWVGKDKVTVSGPPVINPVREGVRLPYKDND